MNSRLALAFGGTVLARLLFYYLTEFTADDAFITFRYAENLASGLGFVYNEGERVLGSTTPLFTLLLATLRAASLPIPATALLISLIASGMTSVLIYRFALRLRFTTLAWLPVIGYALWPRSLPIDISGMETALFTFLTTAAFYYQHKREDIYALAMATLSALTRPEGFGLLILILGYNIYLKPFRWRKYLWVSLSLVLPWLIFASLYFGSPLPNSVAAKMALSGKLGHFTIWETLTYFMGWHRPFGWIMFVMALAGGYWLNRKQNHGWLEILWLGSLVGFYSLGKARMFFWYAGPLYPLYFLFVTGAVCLIVERIDSLRIRRTTCSFLFGLIMAVVLLYGCLKPLKYFSGLQKSQMAAHYEVGVYLHAKVGVDQWVAAEDIGYMGYYSERKILDRDGLVSPAVIPYNIRGDHYQLIADFKPDWVVLLRGSVLSDFYSDFRFHRVYKPQESFESDKFTYDLFKRMMAPSVNDNQTSPD